MEKISQKRVEVFFLRFCVQNLGDIRKFRNRVNKEARNAWQNFDRLLIHVC